MRHSIDLTGQIFGLLTVLYRGVDNGGFVVWICSCRCHPESKIPVMGATLKSGQTKSCGCADIEAKKNMRHRIKLQRAWQIVYRPKQMPLAA
jgi:hypothetical protein